MTIPTKQPYSEERRWATVLFADVQGYTQLAERYDFELVSDLIKEVWLRLDNVIREYGGYVDKHLGDGVMAVWGAPFAKENDAERAVSCGLALLKSMQEHSQESNHPGAHELILRVGLNTGPVLAGCVGANDEFTVIGDTVNIAKRLEQMAEPGTVLISESSHHLVRGEFMVRFVGPIHLRGKNNPIKAYVVERVRNQLTKVRYHSEETLNTRMVGRENEMDQLEMYYEQVVRFRKPILVMVTGDAGIGKSRLLMEFANQLEISHPNLNLFSTRALSQTSRDSFFLWKSLWQNRFDIRDDDSDTISRQKFELGMRKLWESKLDKNGATEAIHLIGNFMGLVWLGSEYLVEYQKQPALMMERVFELTKGIFERICQVGPIVLLLDDLHWADDLSLNLVKFLLEEEFNSMPLLILAGARDTFLKTKPKWANMAKVIKLELLPARVELVKQVFPDLDDLPDEFWSELTIRSDGNPYFLEEMVKGLVKPNLFEAANLNRSIIDRIRNYTPETLRALLQARLDSLSREARMVVLLASVVGRVFWVGPVLAAAKETTFVGSNPAKFDPLMLERVVQNGLRKLVQAEMVFPRAGTRFSENQEYIFKHSILKDVAYGLIPRKHLPHHHLQVARWLVGRQDSKFKVMAAEHFEKAGASDEASRFYEYAAIDAKSRGAVNEADWLKMRSKVIRNRSDNLT